ncbi:hypothetical protein PQX77_005108 [Marasmius sp. AFHP31]|nr:hypothetical protein PQX77_005108 [Marasmius sp. AFHP31]
MSGRGGDESFPAPSAAPRATMLWPPPDNKSVPQGEPPLRGTPSRPSSRQRGTAINKDGDLIERKEKTKRRRPYQITKEDVPEEARGAKKAFEIHMCVMGNIYSVENVPARPPLEVKQEFEDSRRTIDHFLQNSRGRFPEIHGRVTQRLSQLRRNQQYFTHLREDVLSVNDQALRTISTALVRTGLSRWLPDLTEAPTTSYNSTLRHVAIISFQSAVAQGGYLNYSLNRDWVQDDAFLEAVFDHYWFKYLKEKVVRETNRPGQLHKDRIDNAAYKRSIELGDDRADWLSGEGYSVEVQNLFRGPGKNSEDEEIPGKKGHYRIIELRGRNKRVKKLGRAIDERRARARLLYTGSRRAPARPRHEPDEPLYKEQYRLPEAATVAMDWFDVEDFNDLPAPIRAEYGFNPYAALPAYLTVEQILANNPAHPFKSMKRSDFVARYSTEALRPYNFPTPEEVSAMTANSKEAKDTAKKAKRDKKAVKRLRADIQSKRKRVSVSDDELADDEDYEESKPDVKKPRVNPEEPEGDEPEGREASLAGSTYSTFSTSKLDLEDRMFRGMAETLEPRVFQRFGANVYFWWDEDRHYQWWSQDSDGGAMILEGIEGSITWEATDGELTFVNPVHREEPLISAIEDRFGPFEFEYQGEPIFYEYDIGSGYEWFTRADGRLVRKGGLGVHNHWLRDPDTMDIVFNRDESEDLRMSAEEEEEMPIPTKTKGSSGKGKAKAAEEEKLEDSTQVSAGVKKNRGKGKAMMTSPERQIDVDRAEFVVDGKRISARLDRLADWQQFLNHHGRVFREGPKNSVPVLVYEADSVKTLEFKYYRVDEGTCRQQEPRSIEELEQDSNIFGPYGYLLRGHPVYYAVDPDAAWEWILTAEGTIFGEGPWGSTSIVLLDGQTREIEIRWSWSENQKGGQPVSVATGGPTLVKEPQPVVEVTQVYPPVSAATQQSTYVGKPVQADTGGGLFELFHSQDVQENWEWWYDVDGHLLLEGRLGTTYRSNEAAVPRLLFPKVSPAPSNRLPPRRPLSAQDLITRETLEADWEGWTVKNYGHHDGATCWLVYNFAENTERWFDVHGRQVRVGYYGRTYKEITPDQRAILVFPYPPLEETFTFDLGGKRVTRSVRLASEEETWYDGQGVILHQGKIDNNLFRLETGGRLVLLRNPSNTPGDRAQLPIEEHPSRAQATVSLPSLHATPSPVPSGQHATPSGDLTAPPIHADAPVSAIPDQDVTMMPQRTDPPVDVPAPPIHADAPGSVIPEQDVRMATVEGANLTGDGERIGDQTVDVSPSDALPGFATAMTSLVGVDPWNEGVTTSSQPHVTEPPNAPPNVQTHGQPNVAASSSEPQPWSLFSTVVSWTNPFATSEPPHTPHVAHPTEGPSTALNPGEVAVSSQPTHAASPSSTSRQSLSALPSPFLTFGTPGALLREPEQVGFSQQQDPHQAEPVEGLAQDVSGAGASQTPAPIPKTTTSSNKAGGGTRGTARGGVGASRGTKRSGSLPSVQRGKKPSEGGSSKRGPPPGEASSSRTSVIRAAGATYSTVDQGKDTANRRESAASTTSAASSTGSRFSARLKEQKGRKREKEEKK